MYGEHIFIIIFRAKRSPRLARMESRCAAIQCPERKKNYILKSSSPNDSTVSRRFSATVIAVVFFSSIGLAAVIAASPLSFSDGGSGSHLASYVIREIDNLSSIERTNESRFRKALRPPEVVKGVFSSSQRCARCLW